VTVTFNHVPIECMYKFKGCGVVATTERPGPVQCGKCGSVLMEWLNWPVVKRRLKKLKPA